MPWNDTVQMRRRNRHVCIAVVVCNIGVSWAQRPARQEPPTLGDCGRMTEEEYLQLITGSMLGTPSATTSVPIKPGCAALGDARQPTVSTATSPVVDARALAVSGRAREWYER